LRHAVAEDVVADVHVPDDVLETMRVDSGMLFQTELAPPWGIRAVGRAAGVPRRHPGPRLAERGR
jgi:hypothetical protein